MLLTSHQTWKTLATFTETQNGHANQILGSQWMPNRAMQCNGVNSHALAIYTAPIGLFERSLHFSSTIINSLFQPKKYQIFKIHYSK
jgi:hypothetical protein